MYDDWNQDLWWVLDEKTTGDALSRVNGVETGSGMEAYRRLPRWCGKQTDVGVAEFRQMVSRPTQAMREDGAARCIEAWTESFMELKRGGPAYKQSSAGCVPHSDAQGNPDGKVDHIDMNLAERGYTKDAVSS